MLRIIKGFAASEDGASLAEYALLLTFIFLAVIGAVEAVGLDLVPFFETIVADGFS